MLTSDACDTVLCMDAAGARSLAARIQAGVGIGTMIELVSDDADGTRLVPGDCGLVDDVKEDGNLVVNWERGFTSEIHPAVAEYRPLGVGFPGSP
jgi:hypothetical protein